MSGDADPGLDDPLEEAALRLEDGLDRPWMSVTLVGVVLVVHLWIGGIIWSRGNTEFWGILLEERGFRTRLLARCGGMSASHLDEGQFWRLVSAGFLHVNALHLLLNGLALFALGRLCEAIHGGSRLLFLFLVCTMVGACFSWMGGNELSVGASSGIFGMMGAAIVFGWRFQDQLPEDIGAFFRRRLLPWLILNIGIGFVIPAVDQLGHLGGLVGGVILGALMGNRVIRGQQGTRWTDVVFWGSSLLLLSGSVWGLSGLW